MDIVLFKIYVRTQVPLYMAAPKNRFRDALTSLIMLFLSSTIQIISDILNGQAIFCQDIHNYSLYKNSNWCWAALLCNQDNEELFLHHTPNPFHNVFIYKQ